MRRLAPLLASLALALALVPSVLQPGRLLFQRDLLDFFLPMKAAFARAVADGHVPWWDPWTYGGQPFFATLQSQVLYPPNWIFAVAPLAWAMSAFTAAHLAWAGLGAYVLARELGARPSAAGLALVGVGAGGFLVSLVDLTNQLCALTWLPWTWLAACRFATRGSAGALAAWAAGCAMTFLGGEPQYAALGGAASVVLAWGVAADRAVPGASRRAVVGGAAAAALALLACAVQLVPFVELLRASERLADPAFAAAGKHSLEPARLQAFLQAPTSAFGGPAGPYIESLQVGVVVLALALAGLAARRRVALALGGLAAASVLLALGSHVPVLGAWQEQALSFVRYPVKHAAIAAIALPLAAALGLERLAAWAEPRAPRGARWAAWGLVLAAAAQLVPAQARLVVTLPADRLLAPTQPLELLRAEASPSGPRVHVAPLTQDTLRRRAERVARGDLAGAMRERVELLEGALPMLFAIPATGGASALVPRAAAERLAGTDGPLSPAQVEALRAGWLLDASSRTLPLPEVARSPEARLYRLPGTAAAPAAAASWDGPNVVRGEPGAPPPSDWPGWSEGPPGTWTFRPAGLAWAGPLSALAWAALGAMALVRRRGVANDPESR